MTALLVKGGCLYPADPAANVIPDGSVLVEDGRVTAAGPTAEVAALREGVRVIDARGKMILPGFVNPHWHELFGMRLGLKLPLRPPADRADRPAFMALGGDIGQISAAFDSFYGNVERLSPDEALAIARYSMWTQLRCGVTTLGDVGSVNRPQALAEAARELGMRCVVSAWASDAVCLPGEGRFRRTRDADEVLRATEEALRAADGGLVRAWPTAVYGTNMTDELGAGLADLVAKYDVPFATHVGALRNESDAVLACYGATPVRRFAELGLLSERFMAVHCAFADEVERKLLIEAGAHISHSPAKYGGAGESTITETRAIPGFRRAGLDVSLSTDGTALPVGGMAEAMKSAWQTYNEMYADPTELRPTEALAMATSIAARGLDWADEIGSLEPGKQADLLLIPADDWRYLLNPRPLEGFLALGGSMDVDTVMVAGRVLVEGGRATGVDERRLREDYLAALASYSVRCFGIDPELAGAITRREEGD